MRWVSCFGLGETEMWATVGPEFVQSVRETDRQTCVVINNPGYSGLTFYQLSQSHVRIRHSSMFVKRQILKLLQMSNF